MKSKLTELRSRPESSPALVVVDYLQLMSLPGSNKSRNEEVTTISRQLKLLAKEFGIPIIALSQLSRGAAKRDDHTPQLSDLRDSGAIEQDADTVMFIDRPDYYKNSDDTAPKNGDGSEAPKDDIDNDNVVKDAYIYLSKNRQGRTGRVKVCWIARKTLFYEYDKDRRDDDDAGSAYTRTQDSDSAASNYVFEDEAPYSAPENMVEPPVDAGDDELFANPNNDFDSDFLQ
jgi:replicative DNA helicase